MTLINEPNLYGFKQTEQYTVEVQCGSGSLPDIKSLERTAWKTHSSPFPGRNKALRRADMLFLWKGLIRTRSNLTTKNKWVHVGVLLLWKGLHHSRPSHHSSALEKGVQGSVGSCVTLHYVKHFLYPFQSISQPLLVSLSHKSTVWQLGSGPDFWLTRFCSTRLFTHAAAPCSRCLCSTEPLSGESMLHRESLQRKGSRKAFY